MDNRPIGVFDSGIGGLPVLYKLAKAFPKEDFLYLGDNRNVPYGTRSEREIKRLSEGNLRELVSLGVKIIVVACNTVSACIGDDFSGRRIFKIGINQNNREKFLGKGAFLGTPFTVGEILKRSPELKANIDFYPLKDLAGEIEKEPFSDVEVFKHRFAEILAEIFFATKENNFAPFMDIAEHKKDENERKEVFHDRARVFRDHFEKQIARYDFLYLGCTHYLFKEKVIKSLFGDIKCYSGIPSLIENINFYLENNGIFGENLQTIDFAGECARKNADTFAGYVLSV